MASRSSLVYSAAAVRRMLHLRPSTPVHLQEFLHVVWVWVRGRRPTFISKSALKRHFVDHRKVAAQDLRVNPSPVAANQFAVTNPRTGSVHSVQCTRHRLDCTCEDYHQQVTQLGRGCCKHGYAVLAHHGFDSLASYTQFLRAASPLPEEVIGVSVRPQAA